MTTAVKPVRVGIDDALLGDSTFNTLIGGRAYADASKPEDADLPFIAYGTPFEGAFDTFSAAGNQGTRLIHLYGADDDVVETMYGHVKRVLGAGVTVDGHTLLRLSVSLLSIAPDPSGAAHGVVRVAVLTQES